MIPRHLRPKFLRRFLTFNCSYPWLGFVLTSIMLAMILFLRDYVSLSLSITFVFVVLSVYQGGLWWGLASAALVIVAEAFLLWPVGQYGRFVVVTLTLLSVVYLVAILQRKAFVFDSVNGNIKDLLEIMATLQDTLEDWDRYNRDDIRDRIKHITDRVVNLTTRVKAWHDLRQEIEEVQRTANE